jgi:hypothetical protein
MPSIAYQRACIGKPASIPKNENFRFPQLLIIIYSLLITFGRALRVRLSALIFAFIKKKSKG